MNNFIEKLRIKERVEEDIYFAQRDRELIAALRRRAQVQPARSRSSGNHPRGNRPEPQNMIVVFMRNLIRKLCPQCRQSVSAN